MRHLSRAKDGISRFQMKTLRANFGDVLPLDHIEPFVLIVGRGLSLLVQRSATLLLDAQVAQK